MTLNDVRNKRIALQTELNNYLANPYLNEKLITITRGRILKAYVQEYNLETDPSKKTRIHFLLNQEANKHKIQVNERIKNIKKDKNITVVNQISNELGLKFRKLATDMRLANESKTASELSVNMLNTLGNTASFAVSASKVPIIAVLKLSSIGVKYAAKLAVQPLHIPVYLFSKIINPENKYQGKIINNLGDFLGQELSDMLKETEKGVRKI